MLDIKITKTETPKAKPAAGQKLFLLAPTQPHLTNVHKVIPPHDKYGDIVA